MDYKLLGMNVTLFAGNIIEYDYATEENKVEFQKEDLI
jgi:hypothetical protein